MNLPISGPQSVILELLPAYEKIDNLKISLITKYSEYKPITNKLNIYQISNFKNSKLNTVYFFLRSFFKFIQIHKRNPIDVVYIHSFHFDTITPLLIRLFFKVPLFMTTPMDFNTAQKEESSKSHSLLSGIAFYGWMKFFKKLLIKIKKIYIQAINEKIYNDILNLNFSKDNLIKIPNGISINNNLKVIKYKKSETHFGFVGRLIKTKNIRFLIKTFIKYLSKYPFDKLFIYGEGPEEKFILKFIKKYNLEKNIILWGFEKDKTKIYSNIDVLIHPSFSEGIPMILLEAILTDTFILAADVSGNRDIIDNRIHGFLFNPFKENELLKQLLFYKEHQNLIPPILRNAKKKVMSIFDVNIIANRIYQFLKVKLREHG